MKKYILCLLCSLQLSAYELGQGLVINDKLTLSGYVSTEYIFLNNNNSFILDDIAFLAYGSLSSQLSYFVELEASEVYVKDFHNNTLSSDFSTYIERGYIDYSHSDSINIRIGKFITPIGYWNYEHINVLRDSTSSPLYSSTTFPTLVTGLDIYGNISFVEDLHYHLFAQHNDSLSPQMVSVASTHFFGLSLEYDISDSIGLGGSLGQYELSNSPKVIDFIQLNSKYAYQSLDVQSEVIYTRVETSKETALLGYIQGTYHFNAKHALILRYEHSQRIESEQIGILGYSYRPLYPVSFKIEYQEHSNTDNNRALMSLSVLF